MVIVDINEIAGCKSKCCSVKIKKISHYFMILANVSEETFCNDSGVFAPVVLARTVSFTPASKYSNRRDEFYAISSSRKQ